MGQLSVSTETQHLEAFESQNYCVISTRLFTRVLVVCEIQVKDMIEWS